MGFGVGVPRGAGANKRLGSSEGERASAARGEGQSECVEGWWQQGMTLGHSTLSPHPQRPTLSERPVPFPVPSHSSRPSASTGIRACKHYWSTKPVYPNHACTGRPEAAQRAGRSDRDSVSGWGDGSTLVHTYVSAQSIASSGIVRAPIIIIFWHLPQLPNPGPLSPQMPPAAQVPFPLRCNLLPRSPFLRCHLLPRSPFPSDATCCPGPHSSDATCCPGPHSSQRPPS